MRLLRRMLALGLALLCLTLASASAEAPFLVHCKGWNLDATPVDVSLTAAVSAHMPYDDDRLAMLLPILQMGGMRIITGEDGGSVTITLAKNDALTLAAKGDAVQLSCLPDVTYMASGGAMDMLLGEPVTSTGLDFFGLRADAESLLDDGAALLAAIPDAFSAYSRRTTGKTNISGMGTAQYRDDYTVPAEAAALMQAKLLELCPEGWLREIIAGLTFTGKQALRVYYTKGGVLLRMEYTGNCGYGEDIRQTNLIWRMRRDDAARKDEITLRTPAKSGTDKNNLTFTRVIETNKVGAIRMTGEFAYTVTRDKQSDVRKGEFDLTNAYTAEADVLSGAINLRHLPAGDNKYDQYEFEPNLTISGTQDSPRITGTLTVREKWGKGVREEAVLTIELKRAEGYAWEERAQLADLSSLTEEELAAVQRQVASAVTTALVRPLIAMLGEDAAWFFQDMPADQVQEIVDAAQAATH